MNRDVQSCIYLTNLIIMKKKFILFLTFCCALVSAQAQVSGKIIDAIKNEPLQGAKIEMHGHTVLSGANGEFNHPCSGEADIRISYSGYKSFAQHVNCKSGLVIV